MAYLTYAEYTDFGFSEMEESEFDRLLPRASDVLDAVTRNFYVFHDLESDIPFRRENFKKALACQIEYFHEIGATTTSGLNEPATVTIGRTTVSQTVRGATPQNEPQNRLVSEDIYNYLEGTGLLYRGVRVV